MLEPKYLQQISDGAEQIASELHGYIIRQIVERMMIRIGRGDDYLLTSSDRWRIQILQDAGYLLEEITAELEKITKRQEKEIKEDMEEAGIKALEYDHKIYEAVGLSPIPLIQSPQLIRLMERNYRATLGEWRNYTKTTAEAAQRLFINECDFAYNKVMSGAVAYNQAVKEAIESVVSNGVYVEYKNPKTGKIRKDTIETATARAVRTGIAQATGIYRSNGWKKWTGTLFWYRHTSGPEPETEVRTQGIICGGRDNSTAGQGVTSAFLHSLRPDTERVKDYADGTAAIVSVAGMV